MYGNNRDSVMLTIARVRWTDAGNERARFRRCVPRRRS